MNFPQVGTSKCRRTIALGGAIGLALFGGCTTCSEYIHNGFKVGPNYQPPPVPLADRWIDSADPSIKTSPANYGDWWAVFQDPTLNDMIKTAYEQNVNLRIAGTRVLQARALRAVSIGSLFPQQQTATGSYQYIKTDSSFTDFQSGLNASWELDFWGRFRRNIESSTDAVDASVDDYDSALVTLVADLAAAYVQYRTFEQQLEFTRQNVELQKKSLTIATNRFRAGQINELGVVQGTSLLQQIEATIPLLEIGLRQTGNRMCVLLGIPPEDLTTRLGNRSIPLSPAEIAVGIPADLIRRRPDLRSAERLVAAQNAQIGVAEANFYPAFFINGSIGVEVTDFGKPVGSKQFNTGSFGPAFQWNILNYGRILNNVRFQDLKTQELVGIYQQKVLIAANEVEDGIIAYLNSRRQAENLAESVKAAQRAVTIANEQFAAGAIDFTAVFVAEQFLVQQQNAFAQAQGNVSQGLIAVYRAIGGGWEMRLNDTSSPEIAQNRVSEPIPILLPDRLP